MDPEDDKDLDQSLDGDTDDAGDSGSDDSAPQSGAAAGDDKGDKRINDLMSKWQAAEARAKRAESALAAAGNKPDAQKDDSAGGDANEFLDFAREDARRRIFEQDPRLAAYGLSSSAITGSTLDEMKASFAAQKKLVDGIESGARQKVLQEHGLDPEVVAGASEKVKGIAQMSREEFQKLLAERDGQSY